MSHAGELILGALMSAFFALLWRRLDGIERRMDRMEVRLQQIGDLINEVKGRLDEISKHV